MLRLIADVFNVYFRKKGGRAEGASYTFHPNGNITTKTINESTWTYQSNPLEQIESITDPEQNIISFTYDLTGKRLSKHIKVRGKKTKTLRFFYLGDTEIGCLDERGSIIELKIPSNPNNSESPCVAFELKKETYIPIYDLQCNVAGLVDQKRRKIVESYRFHLEKRTSSGKWIDATSGHRYYFLEE